MATVFVNSTISSPAQVVQIVASARFGSPSLELIEDKRQYLEKCVPLYKLAIEGDWKAAKRMLDEDSRLLNAAITKGWGTLLHVAAGSNHVNFVVELMELLDPSDLELKDCKGNTAFCFAAAAGNEQIADIMMKKNGFLPQIRGGDGVTPLHMAALQGKSDMTRYLYSLTIRIFDEEDWNMLFFLCIRNGFYATKKEMKKHKEKLEYTSCYQLPAFAVQAILETFADLSLQMLRTMPILALARDENDETGLHILARKPSDFSCHSWWYLQNQAMNSSKKPTPVLQLVRYLWSMLLSLDFTETQMRLFISQPSQVIFDAAEVGNFHFLAELVRSYPDLIWEVDGKNRSIIHIAVLHRHASIFNLMHEIGSIKDLIVTFEDNEGNNLLHCAAKLATPHQLDLISGEAFQMTHELLWFEEVKKIMLPIEIEKQNSNGKTPHDLFADEHKELLTKAVSWTKGTAKYCMFVSTLIATGVFTVTFCLPGGNSDNTGDPNYLKKPPFLIFAISDVTALISSSASILIFLSILTCRYAEVDYFKSLPLKLIFGLIALSISITSMMISFSVAFFIAYYHGLKWIPNLVSVLAFLPMPLFTYLLFPLWSDVVYSAYICTYLFRPTRHMLY